jgi:hypothetical protein
MITVILNGYKRSSHFERQLNAIKSQTLRPKEIMLWQNKGEDFDTSLTEQTTHANCNKNLGVWARFAFALNARTEYVCIFDDDAYASDDDHAGGDDDDDGDDDDA